MKRISQIQQWSNGKQRRRKCKKCGRQSYPDYFCELCGQEIEGACVGCHKSSQHRSYGTDKIRVRYIKRPPQKPCPHCGALIRVPDWRQIRAYVHRRLRGWSPAQIAKVLPNRNGNPCSRQWVEKLIDETPHLCSSSSCKGPLFPPILYLKVIAWLEEGKYYYEIADLANIAPAHVSKIIKECRRKWPDFVPKRLRRKTGRFGHDINYVGKNEKSNWVVGKGRSDIDKVMDEDG